MAEHVVAVDGHNMLCHRSTLSILFRSNLHVFKEPLQHCFPSSKELALPGSICMPRGWAAYELDGNLSHHLQGHIELFRLLDGAAQVIFGMDDTRGCSDSCRVSQR